VKDIFSLAIVYSTLRLATPLLLAALGGLISERSGIINIAVEGMMLAGAFTSAAVTYALGNPWLGLAAGMCAGMALATIHAILCIRLGADQVVAGTAINILMLGVPTLLSGALYDSSGATPQIAREYLLPNAPVAIAFLLVPGAAYLLTRTRFGLRLRAVGENPEAAEAAGIRVRNIRYIAVLISGAIAAAGGVHLAIGQSSRFTRNMTAGRGYIAVAALIFGKWKPVQTCLACLLFGFAEAASIQLQGVTPYVRVEYVQIIPYIITMFVLTGFIGSSRAPKALGRPFEREQQ